MKGDFAAIFRSYIRDFEMVHQKIAELERPPRQIQRPLVPLGAEQVVRFDRDGDKVLIKPASAVENEVK
jgi:hypothetical protein